MHNWASRPITLLDNAYNIHNADYSSTASPSFTVHPRELLHVCLIEVLTTGMRIYMIQSIVHCYFLSRHTHIMFLRSISLKLIQRIKFIFTMLCWPSNMDYICMSHLLKLGNCNEHRTKFVKVKVSTNLPIIGLLETNFKWNN